MIESLLQNRRTQSSTQHRGDGLVIPRAPALFTKEDKPDAKFWVKDDWKKYQKTCAERNRDCSKLDFVTDENGEVVGRSRLSAMSTRARELFTTLHRHGRDPVSWSTRGAEEAEYFSNIMRTKFQEFSLCDNDWKVHAFATERYPDWCKDVRDGGHLTRIIFGIIFLCVT
jgi:hypothetical protein